MRIAGVYFRAHDPGWAWAPDSGDGAAAHGGRFNPVGIKTLYLAGSIVGMFAEMGHGLEDFFEPLTICSYDVDVEDVVDLTSSVGRTSEGVSFRDLGCAWEEALSKGQKPASWALAERLIRQGAAGILVPSFARRARGDMVNLVRWTWARSRPHKVLVRDTKMRLPKDQASWR